ncbi:MAG TPA: PrsW family intramembrane metalloprotease [Candidatus Aminicenantes bacterium]|nr:PrsW family intramembrane metalloprotease [Candidatus Aminicenantes bacterium]
MSILKVLAAVLLPAAFWIGYFAYKDRLRPEPVRNLIATYVLGIVAGFACIGFYELLSRTGITPDFREILIRSTPTEFFSYSVVFVGLVEEIFKFIPFALGVRRFKAFDEPVDGIVYAAALAVGFASFENLGYLPHLKGFVFLGRAVASPLTHTAFSSIWGYALARAVIKKRSAAFASVAGLGLAGLAHGLYNFLNFSPGLRVLSALLILVIWAWGIRTLEKKPEAA